jgi:Protein of unknown function (DUF732)
MNGVVGIAGSFLVAAGFALAPSARADAENTQEFVEEMHAAGFSGVGSDSFLVMNAWKMCAAMDQGVTPAEVAAGFGESQPDLSAEDVAMVVVLAIQHFCPVHLPVDEQSTVTIPT